MKVYGVILTDSYANVTFLVLKEKAAFRVYIGDKRIRLRKVYIAAFTIRLVLILSIGDLDWAVLSTGSTTPAFII